MPSQYTSTTMCSTHDVQCCLFVKYNFYRRSVPQRFIEMQHIYVRHDAWKIYIQSKNIHILYYTSTNRTWFASKTQMPEMLKRKHHIIALRYCVHIRFHIYRAYSNSSSRICKLCLVCRFGNVPHHSMTFNSKFIPSTRLYV